MSEFKNQEIFDMFIDRGIWQDWFLYFGNRIDVGLYSFEAVVYRNIFGNYKMTIWELDYSRNTKMMSAPITRDQYMSIKKSAKNYKINKLEKEKNALAGYRNMVINKLHSSLRDLGPTQ